MFSLLNYISGFISRNANCQEVLPVVKLFALYDDPRPLPVPDMKRRDCVVKLAAASIYIQLSAFYNSVGPFSDLLTNFLLVIKKILFDICVFGIEWRSRTFHTSPGSAQPLPIPQTTQLY